MAAFLVDESCPRAIILYLPKANPDQRAARLLRVLELGQLDFQRKVTIVTARQVRQRPLPA